MQDKEVGNGNTNCPNGTHGTWHNIFIGGKHHLIYQLLLLLNQLFIQGLGYLGKIIVEEKREYRSPVSHHRWHNG
jgi:hypothetical protein